jgi:RNA polymerase sigma factor (sigma-70 family)
VKFVRETLLTADEERALARAAKAGDKAARDRLVLANQGLVGKLARQLEGRTPWPDLMQAGAIGLMHAVERFNPDLGYRFTTYASGWVYRELVRVRRQRRFVRVPPYLYGNPATIQAKADKGDRIAKAALVMRKKAASTNRWAFFSECRSDGFDVEAIPGRDEGERLYDFDEVDAMREAVAHLPERQRITVEMRHGLTGQPPATFQAIGDRFGVTREMARKHYAGAIAKLQKMLVKEEAA